MEKNINIKPQPFTAEQIEALLQKPFWQEKLNKAKEAYSKLKQKQT